MKLKIDRTEFRDATLAGLAGTGVMTLFMAWLTTVGFPEVDVPAHIVQPLADHRITLGEPLWWVGFAAHLFVGSIVLPLLYLGIKRTYGWPSFPTAWSLGFLFWLIGEGVIIPLTGGGFFSSANPRWELIVLQDLMAHLLYATVLAGLCGHRQLQRRSMQ